MCKEGCLDRDLTQSAEKKRLWIREILTEQLENFFSGKSTEKNMRWKWRTFQKEDRVTDPVKENTNITNKKSVRWGEGICWRIVMNAKEVFFFFFILKQWNICGSSVACFFSVCLFVCFINVTNSRTFVEMNFLF